jgi:hypothetical protein
MGYGKIERKCDFCPEVVIVSASDPHVLEINGYVCFSQDYICPKCVKSPKKKQAIMDKIREIKEIEMDMLENGR